jgi:hypothetical protein
VVPSVRTSPLNDNNWWWKKLSHTCLLNSRIGSAIKRGRYGWRLRFPDSLECSRQWQPSQQQPLCRDEQADHWSVETTVMSSVAQGRWRAGRATISFILHLTAASSTAEKQLIRAQPARAFVWSTMTLIQGVSSKWIYVNNSLHTHMRDIQDKMCVFDQRGPSAG